jgi:transcriptional regulator of nitric oxide reductase/NAD-dependent dihydropyrimidine dehydrogenase PreA subunit
MHFQGSCEWVRGVCIALMVLVLATPALAEKGRLRERLTPQVMAVVYPGAERLGMEEGSPPAIAVYKDDKIVAYVFSTLDIIAAPGYTSTPFDVIAGIDLSGHITGAKVVFHNEPHIVGDALRTRQLDTFLARQAGRALRGGTDPLPPDYVADTTVSARAMRTAVLATAGIVLRSRATRTATTAPALDVDSFKMKSLDELIAEGAVVKRRVSSGDIAAALAKQGASGAKLDWPLGRDDDLYIEFVTALATPAAIGGNLLGVVTLEEYKSKLPSGAEAIYVASSGPYNFLGTKYYESSSGNRFDRLRLIQGGKIFNFVERDYTYAVPVKGQELAGLFALPPHSGFDPLKPWRLEILVNGTPRVSVPFGLDYKLPAAAPPATAASGASSNAPDAQAPAAQVELQDFDLDLPPPVPAWVEAWTGAKVNVAILTVLLTVLTLIFIFQARLARSRLAHRIVRNGFLLVVLVWLGWTAGAQLSTVHVINYAMAPFHHLDFGFYLAEPLIVIIAAYTLISVLLIGRGVFCGWLCPFGALQELLGQISRALGVPQWSPPPALEKRLWMGKYLAAAAVLVLVTTQIDASGATLEIEPFKTAITSKFTRAWPFVIYAGALLAIGLFSERAYCRFLCPLGGLLATLDRLHLLNLLKRRPECGSPCHLCERACPVRAIQPTGKIVTSECFQCLDCQVEYYDETRCPPLVQAVKLRSKTRPIAVTVNNG